MMFNNVSYLRRQQQVVPGVNETLYDTLSKQPRIHCLCHDQGHPEENKSTRNKAELMSASMSSEVHGDKKKKKLPCLLCRYKTDLAARSPLRDVLWHFHLQGLNMEDLDASIHSVSRHHLTG